MTDLFRFAVAQAKSEASRLALDPLHYVRWDEPTRSSQRSQKTVCGRYVCPRATALAESVTCPECRAVLQAEAARSDDPEDVFGPVPTSFPVQSQPFNPLSDYRPKGSGR